MSYVFLNGPDGEPVKVAKHTDQEAEKLRDFQDYFRAKAEGRYKGTWQSWRAGA